MNNNNVIFKGSLNCLTIIMSEDVPFSEILNSIDDKVLSAGKFFKGAVLSVKYRGRKLSKDEEKTIYKLLQSKSGAKIKSFDLDNETPKIEPKIPDPTHPKLRMSNFFFKGLEEGISKFHRGTVRSGQLICFDGNLVVIGDVNPGGEIVATGNIVVMGSIRGIVHAGADGNKEAVIVALNLQPTQLRIADIITRSPDEKSGNAQFIPEMAFVKDDIVYIERYLPVR